MALGSTQPLKEIIIRHISSVGVGRERRPLCGAGNLVFVFVIIAVYGFTRVFYCRPERQAKKPMYD
jgi:hypothetical protein